ncbi:MAG TPA: squalene--hopene cyclase [Planctomycetota bacterium]|nr:squalene--hopene cyclase [Planctomycetota bacterium]
MAKELWERAEPVPVEILLDREIHPDPAAHGRVGQDEGVDPARVEDSVRRAARCLGDLQDRKGWWCAELEANVGLDAQWILCRRYLGIHDPARDARLVRRIRAAQQPDGGWPLYHGAPSDISISIQAYFAGKLCGHAPEEPWMARAREFIRAKGGCEKSSVINRIYMALFGEYPWDGIPAMPVTLLFLPQGAAFNIYEMAYWARTCVVPLLVLYHKRRICRVPEGQGIAELFVTPREQLDRDADTRRERKLSWRNFFLWVNRALKVIERVPLSFHRDAACKRAERWILDHQDADGGWGGIFPAMTHSIMALHTLGYPLESGPVKKGLEAIELLEIDEGDSTRVQPCVSPVWDTAWAVIALAKSGLSKDHPALKQATDWLYSMQIRRKGDWSVKCPGVVPGGWAFQFHNDFYPDTDDSSAVLMALLNSHYRDDARCHEAFDRGIKWLLGMQNEDGGWGAFERGIDNPIWNEIPFNDAKNMLDPSTSDVTGRCVEVLGKLGYPRTHPAVAGGIRFLKKEQEPDGKWWGRWGVNYVYGTWSALAALRAVKEPLDAPCMTRAAEWLRSVQNPDGGWGESCKSYEGAPPAVGVSTASQTAWAVMGLLAAGRGDSDACRRGVEWLLETQKEDGGWDEPEFTGTGFPGVFYLRYHYYRLYFPLLALSRYKEILG